MKEPGMVACVIRVVTNNLGYYKETRYGLWVGEEGEQERPEECSRDRKCLRRLQMGSCTWAVRLVIFD
jgi:hypothetical protein